ncbi:MAG: SDR family NAD(P)-dependent oxidoreductase [Rhodanobacter sp.]
MDSQTILITGATDGLGKALALRFAATGARVILHGRSAQRCDETRWLIARATGNAHVETCVADFARLGDVFAMIGEMKRRAPAIDLLVNNAGLGVESTRTTSEDGYEMVLQVNYLATYALSLGLAREVENASGRIVCVSSLSQAPVQFDDPNYEYQWEGPQSYGRSKWAQIAFAAGIAAFGGRAAPPICSLHPGAFMPTKLVLGKYPVVDTLETGVNTVWLAAHHPLDDCNGAYFDSQGISRAIDEAYDPATQQQLLDLSAEMIAVVRGSDVVPHWRSVAASPEHLAMS